MTPFFANPLKIPTKLASKTLNETNERLQQLEKDNEYLRRGLQKTQSELNMLKDEVKLDSEYVDTVVAAINEFYQKFPKPTPAISAAKPKPARKRRAGKGGRHAKP